MNHETPDTEIELILDNFVVPRVDTLLVPSALHANGLADYVNLEILSFSNCQMTSLNGMPEFPMLHTLYLMDNKLSGTLDILASAAPNLVFLDLSNNKISSLNALTLLQSLDKLQHLNLNDCPVTQLAGYRDKLFELLPQLQILDDMDKDGNEVDDEDAEEEEEEVEQDADEYEEEENGEEEEDEQADEDEVEAPVYRSLSGGKHNPRHPSPTKQQSPSEEELEEDDHEEEEDVDSEEEEEEEEDQLEDDEEEETSPHMSYLLNENNQEDDEYQSMLGFGNSAAAQKRKREEDDEGDPEEYELFQ